MFSHDVIKIMYVNMGYLPGYPYHLISDKEMFDAFIEPGKFFDDYYPCPDASMQDKYDTLRQAIKGIIDDHFANGTTIPNWVYSYMIAQTVSSTSDQAEIDYVCDLGGVEKPNGVAEFNLDAAEMCYETSQRWIQKLPARLSHRPPTMFGEPHVIKSLRLDQANIMIGE